MAMERILIFEALRLGNRDQISWGISTITMSALWFWHLEFLTQIYVQLITQIVAIPSNTQALPRSQSSLLKEVSAAFSHNCRGSHSVYSLSLACLPYAVKKHMAMCWHSNCIYFHPHLLFSLPAFFCMCWLVWRVFMLQVSRTFTQFANSSNTRLEEWLNPIKADIHWFQPAHHL